MEEHLEWARNIAAAVVRRLPTWFTVDDLLGAAEIGLIQAAERYDPARNDSFRKYAQRRVFGACISAIRRREYKERAHQSYDALPQDPPANPHEHAGGNWKQFAELQGPVSEDLRPDELLQEAKAGIFGEVWHLPVNHQRVIFLRYQQGLTLEEIAGILQVGPSWVCRLHREALRLLRPAAERMR